MKHLKPLFALLAVLAFAANMHGQSVYDFSAAAPTGQTLYYKISDSAQVSVVNPRTNNGDSNYVAGNLVIPETVSYCGTTYTVTGLSTHRLAKSRQACGKITKQHSSRPHDDRQKP